jgi:hypothetical protein
MVLAQIARVFSDWWLGLIKPNPYHLTSSQLMNIYIIATSVCGLLLALTGIITPLLSGRVAKTITTTLCHNMASSSFHFFETENPFKVALKINRVWQ